MSENKKQSTSTAVATVPKNISDKVLSKITAFQESGELTLPKNYSVGNALKAAYLVLQETEDRNKKKVLEVCSSESIANALLKMCVQGLSVIKGQGSFIAYGNTLNWQTEYTGNIALAKRYGGLKDIPANVIYEGDEFEFEINEDGRKRVTKHKQTLESLEGKIKGAYATKIMNDGTIDVEIMTMADIKKAWEQGAAKGNSPAHKNFPGEMCKKTVINRACKIIIKSSDDAALNIGGNDDEDIDYVKEDVAHTVKTKANQEIIEIDAEDVTETPDNVDTTTGEIIEDKPQGAGF